jgi:hypothetical protein
MAFLNKIKVTITTGRDRGAGTDGSVYLGLAGREFRCDTAADDFELGATRDYVFGTNANIQRPHDNDPRKPPLMLDEADSFPAYIRFAQGDKSSWLLAGAKVFLNDSATPRFETRMENNPIWLGDQSGCIYYLRKPVDRPG